MTLVTGLWLVIGFWVGVGFGVLAQDEPTPLVVPFLPTFFFLTYLIIRSVSLP